ncbi:MULTISPECIES: antibiotic biosynthesis monooxygenase [Mesorhizobium]|uniref:ABM domain-containing protein n=2 Tax=Mesorhizobium TaxID=68287 RepID=A0ABV2I058_9HYPH|nr:MULTISPECIES: antibiotic biosynthesis monooxygenase [unclassified Mesorhizobium]AZO27681.1 hypothetical protein EJ071_09775 [Mesorhizobium sp. M1B.F.Ca.ET.045.04.1.1]RWA69605.1 MAG: hypothetical protein EOQ29_16920 [Mesorhizobium sp.]RWA78452.1 MAG: hypothetical protein EOQ30_29295 [Mesorhizobium sp.]RWB19505.1 MAG: hypothetical protein EOQ40_19665 [Mesorhizobium sp.]RWE00949.1 MAG: hypothetical protein EOS40_13295 [Mesorhizobium sp.]
MTAITVEMAKINLAVGKSEAELVAASERFQREFLGRQPGFLRRELLRLYEGNYLDLVHWRSAADARAVMEHAMESPQCQAYFAVMAMDADKPDEGVAHYTSLAVYG